ncbi:MAG: ribonuclease J [Actinobacteria bacterium]|nr:ribonuclease J [Actinomycetota bacterium]
MVKSRKLKLIPLGGLGEVGKNMLVVEYGADIIVIDAGLMFPREEMLGIDLVLPDFSYLKRNKERILAVFLTHGHEDHIGALPYLLKEINVPVYGTKLTLGLAKGKLGEHRLSKNLKLREIKPENDVTIGSFRLQFIRVNHSIPDGVAIAIHTPVGIVLHSGDFKIDQTPIDGKLTEFGKFALLANQQVLAFLSDSTNAELPGYTLPERTVGDTIGEIFEKTQNRIIAACFASHIHRIQQIIDAAGKNNRKVAICGRSMVDNVNIASKLGYLNIPSDLTIDTHEIVNLPLSKVVVLCTGSQGEPLSALTRMASRNHKHVEITKGDSVIISATPVPGNEKAVQRTIDQLFRCGAEVYYESISDVHVSGHAAKEELKLMLNLIRPKYFIPIHGEHRHLQHHAALARELGVSEENIFILENGDVVQIDKKTAEVKTKVTAGDVFVDGLGVGDIGDVVLRDRQQLSQDGIFVVVATINRQTCEVVAGPDIVSRGFVYMRESGELINEAREKVRQALEEAASEEITDWAVLRSRVRNVLSKYLYEKTRRRPMIVPVIMEF